MSGSDPHSPSVTTSSNDSPFWLDAEGTVFCAYSSVEFDRSPCRLLPAQGHEIADTARRVKHDNREKIMGSRPGRGYQRITAQ